ncbi:MAG TPA: single-stranded DNA-binding protein [Tepidisphaeraceae bacterium]|jgi:single-strand DNA-binding protein|nr:single-stranded DNA-binding protein [Tepidisphaeraceae bacterium]
MANFNKVILAGNLTRDPQLRYLPSQTAVVDFGLAVNHRWRTPQGEDREEVLFIDCTCFGKQAETINKYCQKGKPILIEGRLKYETWDDKEGGGKRSKHKVVVDNFQFIGGKDGGGGGGGGGGGEEMDQRPRSAPRPQQSRPAPSRPDAQPPISDEEHFKEDDIPF